MMLETKKLIIIIFMALNLVFLFSIYANIEYLQDNYRINTILLIIVDLVFVVTLIYYYLKIGNE